MPDLGLQSRYEDEVWSESILSMSLATPARSNCTASRARRGCSGRRQHNRSSSRRIMHRSRVMATEQHGIREGCCSLPISPGRSDPGPRTTGAYSQVAPPSPGPVRARSGPLTRAHGWSRAVPWSFGVSRRSLGPRLGGAMARGRAARPPPGRTPPRVRSSARRADKRRVRTLGVVPVRSAWSRGTGPPRSGARAYAFRVPYALQKIVAISK